MKLKAVPGFVLVEAEDGLDISLDRGLWRVEVKTDLVRGRVIAVGRSTWGYDSKYYSTDDIKVGDTVVFRLEHPWYEVFDRDEGRFVKIYKIPVSEILAKAIDF